MALPSLTTQPTLKEHLVSAGKTILAFMLLALVSQLLQHQDTFTSLAFDKAILTSIALAVVRSGIAAAFPLIIENLKDLALWLKK